MTGQTRRLLYPLLHLCAKGYTKQYTQEQKPRQLFYITVRYSEPQPMVSIVVCSCVIVLYIEYMYIWNALIFVVGNYATKPLGVY